MHADTTASLPRVNQASAAPLTMAMPARTTSIEVKTEPAPVAAAPIYHRVITTVARNGTLPNTTHATAAHSEFVECQETSMNYSNSSWQKLTYLSCP